MTLTLSERQALWRVGELRWKLHSGQRKIYNELVANEQQEIAVFCARQFGKSYLSVIIALEYCIKNPGSIVRIAAPTLKQVRDIVQDNLGPICEDAPDGLIKRHKTEYRWTVGKSSLRLGALERAHSDAMRGGNAKLIITEEGGFVSSEDYRYAVSSVIGPQLLHSKGKLFHVTSPSEDPEHFIHTEIKKRCEESGTFFTYTVYDNPRLTQEQIDQAIRLCGGVENDDWKREYLCEIIRPTSFVCVPEFNDVHHVGPAPTRLMNLCVAVDVGGTQDKTVGLLIGWDKETDTDWILQERVFESNTASDVMIEGFNEFPYTPNRVVDAPGQLKVDWVQLHGYTIRNPIKDDWKSGLNNLRVRLRLGKLKISPDCPFTIATFKGAMFNKDRTDFARTKRLGHMDALAAASYGLRSLDRRTDPMPASLPTGDNVMILKRTTKTGSEGNRALASLFSKR